MALIDVNPHIMNGSITHKIVGGQLRMLVVIRTDLELDPTAKDYDKASNEQLVADVTDAYQGKDVDFEITN